MSYRSTLSPRQPRIGLASDPRQLHLDFEQGTPPSPTKNADYVENALSRFAARFAAVLDADASAHFDNRATNELAREIFGSAAGHSRDAYDAAEAGFNLYLARTGLDVRRVKASINWLREQEARLPRQNKRDHTQVEFQQFSTPHAEGLVVLWAAALRSDMAVLEPSAGTGNLAVLARLAGCQVDTNEIDPRRRLLLTLQGFDPTDLDAERLDNLLPPEKTYDAIVMNPPFSATGGRVRGHDGAFGARHVEQALLRLKPGGRLVALVGPEMSFHRTKVLKWWDAIQDKYRLRANIGIDGREYARFGTTYDHQIIVIDHDGPTPSAWSVIMGDGVSIARAAKLLRDLSKEDVYGRVRERDQGASPNHSSREFQQEAALGIDPIVELIGALLADEYGGEAIPANLSLMTDQWLTWNELALRPQNELTQTINQVLERESTKLPQELAALRTWAGWLVLSVLDQRELA